MPFNRAWWSVLRLRVFSKSYRLCCISQSHRCCLPTELSGVKKTPLLPLKILSTRFKSLNDQIYSILLNLTHFFSIFISTKQRKMMLQNLMVVLMVIHASYAKHFHGGSMSWRPINDGRQVRRSIVSLFFVFSGLLKPHPFPNTKCRLWKWNERTPIQSASNYVANRSYD